MGMSSLEQYLWNVKSSSFGKSYWCQGSKPYHVNTKVVTDKLFSIVFDINIAVFFSNIESEVLPQCQKRWRSSIGVTFSSNNDMQSLWYWYMYVQALKALEQYPTPKSRQALTSTIENEKCFYSIRIDAARSLAKVSVFYCCYYLCRGICFCLG